MEAWRIELAAGNTSAAWDLFLGRYRRLILAVISRLVDETEDRADVFSTVCFELWKDDLKRLRRYDDGSARRARFSTWLVTVVHNLVIDWRRRRFGRPRIEAPSTLTPLQSRIFTLVFLEHRSHAEAFGMLSGFSGSSLSFEDFLRELAATYREVEGSRPKGVMHFLGERSPSPTAADSAPDPAAKNELRDLLRRALESLDADDRRVIEYYVVEGRSAAEVAEMLGWSSAKAVYNRAYRSLGRLRQWLEERGVSPTDL